MRQATATTTLELVLAAPAATTELPFVVSYVDIMQVTGEAGEESTQHGISDGATPVTMSDAPAPGVRRQITDFTIPNVDTAEATVTVRMNFNGTTRIKHVATLRPGATLQYSDKAGFSVLEPTVERAPVIFPLGGDPLNGRTSDAWVEVRGAKIARINGDLFTSAVADVQLLTTDGGTPVTLRVYNRTADTVAGTTDPCTDTDDTFPESNPDQRQRIAITLESGDNDYVLQQIGGNDATNTIGFGQIEATPA